jgi:hypothetical protein
MLNGGPCQARKKQNEKGILQSTMDNGIVTDVASGMTVVLDGRRLDQRNGIALTVLWKKEFETQYVQFAIMSKSPVAT